MNVVLIAGLRTPLAEREGYFRLLIASTAVGTAVSASAGSAIAAATTASAVASATAVSAATVAAAITAAAIATLSASFLARTRFVDGERTIVVIGVVERFDRPLGFLIVFHFDEAETARASSVAVGDDLGAGYFPEFAEQIDEVVGRDPPNQVADIDVLSHSREMNLSRADSQSGNDCRWRIRGPAVRRQTMAAMRRESSGAPRRKK